MAANTQLKRTEKKFGRPSVDIDWNKVDELLIAGCSGAEVASYIGINRHTLYDRCVSDKSIPFSDYSQQKNEKGDSILRAHQYAKALGLTDKGDNTLLIWLGKTRLKQKENEDQIIVSTEQIAKYEAVKKAIENYQTLKSDIKEKGEIRNHNV